MSDQDLPDAILGLCKEIHYAASIIAAAIFLAGQTDADYPGEVITTLARELR
jgi:hypothetical protein